MALYYFTAFTNTASWIGRTVQAQAHTRRWEGFTCDVARHAREGRGEGQEDNYMLIPAGGDLWTAEGCEGA